MNGRTCVLLALVLLPSAATGCKSNEDKAADRQARFMKLSESCVDVGRDACSACCDASKGRSFGPKGCRCDVPTLPDPAITDPDKCFEHCEKLHKWSVGPELVDGGCVCWLPPDHSALTARGSGT